MLGSYLRAKSALVSATLFTLALGGLMTLGVVQPSTAAAAPGPIAQRDAGAVTADALPTVQIDGVVWDQQIVGDTVYAGGQFSNARPAGAAPGTNLTPRSNLLAYNIRTGALITSFAPTVNGKIKTLAVSPDGTRLYIGGSFTQVNGANRYRIASFDTATGALTSFAPNPDAAVNAIAVSSTAVYAGGGFSKVGSIDRLRLAAFSPTNGALLGWAPTADNGVNALLLTPDKSRVLAAGAFGTVNNSPATGLASLDVTNGASLPWAANQVIHDYGSSAAMLSLSTDGTNVYSGGYWYGGTGNFEGVLAADPTTGAIKWLADCHGDTYDASAVNGTVYAVSHHHYCSNIGGFPDTNPRTVWHRANAFSSQATGTVAPNGQGGYADFSGQRAPSIVNWFPDVDSGTYTGQAQGGWTTTGTNEYVVQGGEFPAVNGTPQQGLVRFAIPSLAPRKQGPRVAGAAFNPRLLAVSNNSVRVTWQANWDRDDELLSYSVIRADRTATPLVTQTQTSQFWNRPAMSYTDAQVTPGQTYRYKVTASDPDGNVVQSENVSITVPTTANAYITQVVQDGASNYWRMNGTGSYPDSLGATDLTATTGVTANPSGALTGDADGAASFDGSTGAAGTSTPIPGPNTFTAEAWFKTTTTSGGKILGFGNASSGTSGSYDRHLYLDNDGRLDFGVYNGNVSTLRSAAAYNDGQWHHAAAELSPAGTALYVDGVKVGSDARVTGGQDYPGFWRVGSDNLNGWPNQPSSSSFNGSIDEVAIYPSALSATQLRQHYTNSGRTVKIPAAPTDAYGKAVHRDDPALYWRLDDTSGPTAADTTPNAELGGYSGGVTYSTPSNVSGSTGSAVTFNGSDATLASTSAVDNPTTYSEELWFQTTTTNGGKLIGFGDARSGNSGNYDRHVYLETSGQLTYGVWTGQPNLATSPNSYNDGKWHQLVATQSADGMKLYVDGTVVATNAQTSAQAYSGYWRVGGDSSWAGNPYFAGSIDEVAVYPTALTAAQVQAHYSASPAAATTLPANTPPNAAVASTCAELACSFDGSASADADGTIANYAWDFGDGGVSTLAKPTHTYAATGTYPVTLTVTDDGGAKDVATKSVAVTANAKPVAALTVSCTGLSCDVDGSTSTDSDGTVSSYAWDFGDGGTSSAAKTTHAFVSPGTYSITLKVTDNSGAVDTATKSVTVTAPANRPPTATFASSVSGVTAGFDASGSTDPDGGALSYAWQFGDGAVGTGVGPSHTYAGTGNYAVTLKVTDNAGADTSVTKTVQVATDVVAADAFDRTVTKWGTADRGGAWTYSGSVFSTSGTSGDVKVSAVGGSARASLAGVSQQNVNVVADLSLDTAATGGGIYNTFIVRKIGTSDYRMSVQHVSGGAVRLKLVRTVNGTATTLKEVAVSGVAYKPGDVYRVRLQVSGTTTATLSGKLWKAGTPEPAGAQVIATDATAALQAPGSFALDSYVSTTTTTIPKTSFDNLVLTSK